MILQDTELIEYEATATGVGVASKLTFLQRSLHL